MQIPVSSRIRLYVPVWPPHGTDPTIYPVEIALTGIGDEPADADYHPAEWAAGRVTVLPAVWEAWMMVGPGGTGVVFPPGDYMAWARVDVGPLDERPVLKSGRVRIGEQ